MSHFSLWFLGDPADIEEKMIPYQEYNMDTADKQYLEFVDCTDEVLLALDGPEQLLDGTPCSLREKASKKFFDNHHRDPTDAEILHKVALSPHFYYEEESTGGRYGYYHNPNGFWDWYVVGDAGRWGKTLLTIDGDRVSSCKLKNLDIAGMKAMSARLAAAEYQAYIDALGNLPLPPEFDMFASAFASRDEGRAAYFDLPSVIALNNARIYPRASFLLGREAYIVQGEDSALPFATLSKEGWIAKGEMLMFGSSHKIDDDYPKRVETLLKGLPGSTAVTVIDCHT